MSTLNLGLSPAMSSILNPAASTTSSSSSSSSSSSDSGSQGAIDALGNPDTFLQLLVAQLKYQDPSSPADGTAFVTQLATFSGVEEQSAMRGDLDSINTVAQQYASTLPPATPAPTTPPATTPSSSQTSNASGVSN